VSPAIRLEAVILSQLFACKNVIKDMFFDRIWKIT